MNQKFDLSNRVDLLVVSAEEGIEKPDPVIYRLTAEQLGVAPEQCLFVDDVAGHVAGAISVGMIGIHHRDAEHTLAAIQRAVLGMVDHRYRAAGGIVFRSGEVLVLWRASRAEWRLRRRAMWSQAKPTRRRPSARLPRRRATTTSSSKPNSAISTRCSTPLLAVDPASTSTGWSTTSECDCYRIGAMPRPPDDEKFTPRWLPIGDARALLTYDSEREWLVQSFGYPSA